MKTIVILGTARDDGNTLKAVQDLCPFQNFDLIDLRQLHISPYNYQHDYPDTDNFIEVAQAMSQADNIVFATPVYWYSMSASLKTFFDRMSDLISVQKSIGRSLKGKRTFLISTGWELSLPSGFEEPFRLTSEYFEMNYQGSTYKSVR